MHNHPPRVTPMMGALTTIVERWVSQDVARGNAAAAANRLHRQRAELDEVDTFLAARRRAGRDDRAQGRRSSRAP
ncbi:MAG TPA: hypothetical protein VFY58_09805 [Nocardioides sp.]|nr:hypothetical protein [Nocardioides sp.]